MQSLPELEVAAVSHRYLARTLPIGPALRPAQHAVPEQAACHARICAVPSSAPAPTLTVSTRSLSNACAHHGRTLAEATLAPLPMS